MQNSKRDHRVDFLRGLSLASIFINHVPGNLYEKWTHKNFGFSDAAEVFVILAGFASAYAYYAGFARGERWTASLKALKRAWILYLAHITTTIAGVAIFSFAALWLGKPAYVDDSFVFMNLKTFFDDPQRGLIGIATLGHQLGYFNILSMYMALLVMVPAMMWLASKDLRLLWAASIALYLIAALTSIDIPNYPLPGGWFFNPFAWQLLFVFGFTLGQWRREGKVIPLKPWLLALSLVYLILAYWWIPFDWLINFSGIELPRTIWSFDKTFVALPRLFHVLALTYAVTMLLGSAMARISPNNPLTAMGRHSLPIFCVGSLLSMIGTVLHREAGGGIFFDTLIIGAGLTLQFLLARLLDGQHPQRPKTVPSAQTQPT